jgi:hypothetical protein
VISCKLGLFSFELELSQWIHSWIGIPQSRLRLALNWVNKSLCLIYLLLFIFYIVHCVFTLARCWNIIYHICDQRAGISIGIRAGILFCFWVRSMEDTFWLYGQGRRRCACCSDTVLVVACWSWGGAYVLILRGSALWGWICQIPLLYASDVANTSLQFIWLSQELF